MADLGRWSHKYHLDGRDAPNESIPGSDVYYSLNVLLGLSNVPRAAYHAEIDVADLLQHLCKTALNLPVRQGTWGMALWAASALGMQAPASMCDKLATVGRDVDRVLAWQAQDVGLSLTGACVQARHDRTWLPVAKALRDTLMAKFRGPGALFRDGAQGIRRHFATFATQVYAALALYHYGELCDDVQAMDAANLCVGKLIALQGLNGEWPWFYSPGRDCVLDYYEIYSVHQHGMAPALLHHAVRAGVPGSGEALTRGFRWIFGANDMQQAMLVPELSLIYRSQARCGIGGRRDVRLLRAAAHLLSGETAQPSRPAKLRLTCEMRSYEFGWLLWSFSGRTDYAELTYNPAFSSTAE